MDADFDFHVAIAEASGNPYFPRLLQSLGATLIPRRRIEFETPEVRQAYLQRVQDEHRAIEDAIAKGNVAGARRAMEKHLSGSRYRLRLRLGEESGTVPVEPAKQLRTKAAPTLTQAALPTCSGGHGRSRSSGGRRRATPGCRDAGDGEHPLGRALSTTSPRNITSTRSQR